MSEPGGPGGYQPEELKQESDEAAEAEIAPEVAPRPPKHEPMKELPQPEQPRFVTPEELADYEQSHRKEAIHFGESYIASGSLVQDTFSKMGEKARKALDAGKSKDPRLLAAYQELKRTGKLGQVGRVVYVTEPTNPDTGELYYPLAIVMYEDHTGVEIPHRNLKPLYKEITDGKSVPPIPSEFQSLSNIEWGEATYHIGDRVKVDNLFYGRIAIINEGYPEYDILPYAQVETRIRYYVNETIQGQERLSFLTEKPVLLTVTIDRIAPLPVLSSSDNYLRVFVEQR